MPVQFTNLYLLVSVLMHAVLEGGRDGDNSPRKHVLFSFINESHVAITRLVHPRTW